jgi:acetolactate decarboxylase
MRADRANVALSVVSARSLLPVIVVCLMLLPSCIRAKPAPRAAGNDQITQVSVINALMIGRYDGVMPIPELLRHGDFGVGTLDHLDGELIVLDGHAYQVRGDGRVVSVGADRSTPFAIVTPFEPDGESSSSRIGGLSELDTRLDSALPQKNELVAIRVDGRFASITLRSVKRQEPPYRPLADVAESQSVWTHAEVSGTLVGIRCPAWVNGLNVPGYHWHFLSDDHTVGGHVLDCRAVDLRVHFDVCRDWLIKLDNSTEFNSANLGEDLSQDLRRVESSRGETPAQEKVPATKAPGR